MTKLHTYPSGLRLVVNEMPNTRSVSIGIFVNAGSEYENSENNGISHFLEHMFFRGTNSRSAFDIANEMEKIGARINAFTSKNQTTLYTISLDDHAERCMELLSDLIYNSKFDESEIQKEKSVVIEEIQMNEDDPEDLCFDNLCKAYYGENGPGRNILGTIETVSSFTQESLFRYVKENYLPANLVVSVAGNINLNKAMELTNKYIENRAILNSSVSNRTSQVNPILENKIIIKPLEQANIAFAFPGYRFSDKLAVAQNMLSNLLGGGMSSRLFQSIREDLGLAYNIYTQPLSYLTSGIFTIYLGTSPKNTQKAIKAIKTEIDKLLDKGFTVEEITKAKEQMKTGLVLGLESSSTVMIIAGKRALLKQEIFNEDEEVKEIEKVTLEDLSNAIRHIFCANKYSISYVGKEFDFNIQDSF
jgi:predicted Zn-dependent peptidase